MRFFCGMMLLLAAATNLWAQREPCLTGIDSPDCGIKITLNPPLSGNILPVPNKITIEVPMRLHPAKIQLNSGPMDGVAGDFKPFLETTHYKKVKGAARFQMEIKSCPETDNAFEFYIIAPHFPYPFAVNSAPYECKAQAGK
ncbi:MAG TPA: hypothetical protein VKV05_03195 [Terriglobales bacterium]|nr:hypothetical protein [Terriglobales bacterium]